MRMAIVEIIGYLIRELACSEDLTSDAHQTQKQLNGLYDLLLERTLDLSSYVRSRVFSVLSRLCDLPVKFPKQRLAITRAAVAALEDKVAGVRKNASCRRRKRRWMTRSLAARMRWRRTGVTATGRVMTRVVNRLLLDQRKRKRGHGAVSCVVPKRGF